MTNSKFENPEDEKLAILARATLRRTGAKQSGALRDSTGRTYVGINIATPSFSADAAISILTIALTSQISGIESAVFIGDVVLNTAPLREYSPHCSLWFITESGEITAL